MNQDAQEHIKGPVLCAAKCFIPGSPIKDTAAAECFISLTGKSILIKAVRLSQRSNGGKKAAAKYQDPVFA